MGKEYKPFKMEGHTLPGINQRLDDHPENSGPPFLGGLVAKVAGGFLKKKAGDVISSIFKPKDKNGENSSTPYKPSPAKDNVKPTHAHTASGGHPKKQTDEQFIAKAKKQKSDTIANLTKKAENQGLSREAAKKAALAEYKRNI